MEKPNYLHDGSFKLLFYKGVDNFVEAMHLIDEDDRALLRQAIACDQGTLHRLANVLHATEYRADAQELRIEGRRHQTRDGRLANARWPPQNARMGLARFKGNAQRHAWAQQMLLADDFAEAAGPQALGQRRM